MILGLANGSTMAKQYEKFNIIHQKFMKELKFNFNFLNVFNLY